jgi:hypothetical protein
MVSYLRISQPKPSKQNKIYFSNLSIWHTLLILLDIRVFIGAGIAQWFSTGLRAGWSGVPLPVGAGNFSPHYRVQTGSGPHPASYPLGTRRSFPGGKVAEAWSWSLPCSAEVRNAWSYTSSPTTRLHGVVFRAQGRVFIIITILPNTFLVTWFRKDIWTFKLCRYGQICQQNFSLTLTNWLGWKKVKGIHTADNKLSFL